MFRMMFCNGFYPAYLFILEILIQTIFIRVIRDSKTISFLKLSISFFFAYSHS